MGRREKGPTNNEGTWRNRHGRLVHISPSPSQVKALGGEVDIKGLLQEIHQKPLQRSGKREFKGR